MAADTDTDVVAKASSNTLYRQVINPIAPRKTKIVHNFGLSGCNGVKEKSLAKMSG